MKRSKTHRSKTRSRKTRVQKGGAKDDICGICPICDSAETRRYATSPAGNIVYCTCVNGHIYSN